MHCLIYGLPPKHDHNTVHLVSLAQSEGRQWPNANGTKGKKGSPDNRQEEQLTNFLARARNQSQGEDS